MPVSRRLIYQQNRKTRSFKKLTTYKINVDEYGCWIPAANQFPSTADGRFKKLADYIHSKALKFALHLQ